MDLISIILAVFFVIILGLYLLSKAKVSKLETSLRNENSEFLKYKSETEHLRKYEAIDDAKKEANRILSEARDNLNKTKNQYHKKIEEAENLAASELKEARAKAKEIRRNGVGPR